MANDPKLTPENWITIAGIALTLVLAPLARSMWRVLREHDSKLQNHEERLDEQDKWRQEARQRESDLAERFRTGDERMGRLETMMATVVEGISWLKQAVGNGTRKD